MTRRRTVGALACLATVPVLLAGCSSAQQASQTLPTTTPPAAASSTASPTLPPLGPADMPMPVSARSHDSAGVEAFTRYYLALINRTSHVMDATALRTLSDGCSTCDRIASDTDKDRSAGYHYEGGELTITSAAPARVQGASGEFDFIADQAALTVADAGEHPVVNLSAQAIAHLSSGAAVRWDAQQQTWLMTQLTLG